MRTRNEMKRTHIPAGFRFGASRVALGLIAVLSMGLACVSGAKRPDAPVRGTLSLPSDPSNVGETADGPLSVVFATPRGPTEQRTEISLVFNKPVRALEADPDAGPFPVTVSPPLSGNWQWLGSSALRFNAEEPMPLATSFGCRSQAVGEGP